MKHSRFQIGIWMSILASALAFQTPASGRPVVSAQALTPTEIPGGPGAYITVTYSEPVNVRTGPSTVYYPVIGQLPVGTVAPALGASPSRVWIQIEFPAGPGGVGWVYAANVTLTGTLRIVEPPPTATPLASPTFDQTLAAAFTIQPTATRLPTFTPPAPLVVPTFADVPDQSQGFPMGIVILVLFLIGILVLFVSFLGRR